VLLFAGFTILAFTGLFNLVETRFYNPSITRAITREIDEDAKTVEEFLQELQTRFAVTLRAAPIQRSFLAEQGAEDITERSKLYGTLQESLGGLQSIRFIDSGGGRIHYSTYAPDILRQDHASIAYRNYNEITGYIPYGQVEATDRGGPRLILDEAGERVIFSHPFYDSFDVYRGTALFSLSIRAIMDRMVSAGRLKVGEDLSIISEPPGIIAGLPHAGGQNLIPPIASAWGEGIFTLGRLRSGLTETNLALISAKTVQGIFIGRLVNESLLSFPPAMKIILLISFLLTVYLIIFLLFNLHQDNMTIIQNRLKRLQVNLIEEYYEHKGNVDWGRWKKELEQRKEEVRTELKRGLKPRAESGNFTDIDALIDKSWDELLAVIGGRVERRANAGIDEEKLQALLNRVLLNSPLAVPPAAEALEIPIPFAASIEDPAELKNAEAIDEIGALEDMEQESTSIAEEKPEKKSETADLEEISLESLDEPETVEMLEDTEPSVETETEPVVTDEPVVADEPVVDPEEVLDFLAEAMPPEKDTEVLDTLEEVLIEDLEAIPNEPFDDYEEISMDESDAPPITFLDALASEIEFSPLPEEIEKEKEVAAKSITDGVEIVSPFSTILSDFSNGESSSVESLEQLEALGQDPVLENTLETDAEALKSNFVKSLLPGIFQTEQTAPVGYLEVVDDDMTITQDPLSGDELPENTCGETAIIEERNGVNYISESILSQDTNPETKLNWDLKNLIDSVLKKG
jgi:hypothetical protein